MTSPAIAPSPEITTRPVAAFFRRLWGLGLRHIYLHINSWPRLIEMLYWPVINMATWGFTSVYLVRKLTHVDIISTTLVAGVLMIEIFMRMSVTMLMLFLEEVWSRNLGHLFASPLRCFEYTLGLTLTAFTRILIALTPAFILAKILFGFSLPDLGWPALSFAALLVFNGCWYGLLLLALMMRFGLAAEWLAWMGTWLLTPLVAAYYPVSVLPRAVQYVSLSLPATYVFQSMQSLVSTQELHSENLFIALGLNIFYSGIAAYVFWRAYRYARKHGGLLQMGE